MTNITLFSNNSSPFLDIQPSIYNYSSFSTFYIPPPPPGDPHPSVSRPIEILNDKLFNSFNRWILEKLINSIISFQKNSLSLPENKTFLTSTVRHIIPEIFTVYPVFLGVDQMTFYPIEGSEVFKFNLSDLDHNGQRKLTVRWENRQVTLNCTYIEDASKQFSAMVDHYDYHKEGGVAIKLRDGLVAYVIDNEMMQSFLLEKELDSWCNQKEVSATESRQGAVIRIRNCYGQKAAELNLSNLGLSSLPNCFRYLAHLTKIDLNYNQLGTLPESFGSLVNLKTLYLNGNKLSSLPENFGNLVNLDCIDLNYNQLSTLPESFGNLVNLNLFYSKSNSLTTLPKNFGNLVNLSLLDLSYNQLSSLPENFGNLVKLNHLDLSYNQLSSLLENFGNLVNLSNLNLSHNLLSSLLENFGNLVKLNILCLNHNRLTILPEFRGNHSRWVSINLGSNPYRSLPESILELPSHLNIYLDGHNLSEHVLNNLQLGTQERRAQGQPTSTFIFDMPPPRNSVNPNSLEDQIKELSIHAEIEALQFDTEIFNDAADNVGLWLHYLLQTSDFTSGGQKLKKELAKVVLDIFEFASQNEDFRIEFYNFLCDAVISCVDRVTLSVIELEILVQLKKLSQNAKNRQEVVKLLRNVWATHLLHKIAKKKVDSLSFFDELDVHLGFFIHCKPLLEKIGIKLPFTSEHMQFFGITGITDQDLSLAAKTVESEMQKLGNEGLVEFLFLKDDLEKGKAQACLELFEKTFNEETTIIKQSKNQDSERIDQGENLNSGDQIAAYAALENDQKAKYVQLLADF